MKNITLEQALKVLELHQEFGAEAQKGLEHFRSYVEEKRLNKSLNIQAEITALHYEKILVKNS